MEQRDNSASLHGFVTVNPEMMCTVLCISLPEKNSTRQKRKLIKSGCSTRNNDHCSKLMSKIFNFTVDSSIVFFCIS